MSCSVGTSRRVCALRRGRRWACRGRRASGGVGGAGGGGRLGWCRWLESGDWDGRLRSCLGMLLAGEGCEACRRLVGGLVGILPWMEMGWGGARSSASRCCCRRSGRCRVDRIPSLRRRTGIDTGRCRRNQSDLECMHSPGLLCMTGTSEDVPRLRPAVRSKHCFVVAKAHA